MEVQIFIIRHYLISLQLLTAEIAFINHTYLFYLRIRFKLESENLEFLKGGEYAIKLSCLPSQYSIYHTYLFYLRVGFNLEGENLESLKGGEYAIKLSCLPSQYSITNADRNFIIIKYLCKIMMHIIGSSDIYY